MLRTAHWRGYGFLDTKLRVRGVRNDPKKEALRQAVQGRGRPGGAERRDEGRRPRKGAWDQGFRARPPGSGIRGDGRRRLSRQRKPQGRQGPRDREAPEEGRGARARERAVGMAPCDLERDAA